MTSLVHFSNNPQLKLDQSRPWHEPGRLKPRGLWVSVEGDDSYGWSRWCADNEFERGKFAYEVTLAPSARILTIDSTERLDEFDEKWRATPEYWDDPIVRKWHPSFDSKIDWQAVARRWQGIIIAPYIYARRLDLMWYYGWDCASGCVWDLTVIASVECTSIAAFL